MQAFSTIEMEHEVQIVRLDELKIGEYSFDFHLDTSYFSTIEPSELLGGEVDVRAHLKLGISDVVLCIKVEGKVQVTCDRCLDVMDIMVSSQEQVELDGDEKELDLAWLAYEQIIINLPLVHSHPNDGCNPEMIALLQDHLCSTLEEPEE